MMSSEWEFTHLLFLFGVFLSGSVNLVVMVTEILLCCCMLYIVGKELRQLKELPSVYSSFSELSRKLNGKRSYEENLERRWIW